MSSFASPARRDYRSPTKPHIQNYACTCWASWCRRRPGSASPSSPTRQGFHDRLADGTYVVRPAQV